MKLEQLKYDPLILESMSDEEVTKLLSPHFNVTRPDPSKRPKIDVTSVKLPIRKTKKKLKMSLEDMNNKLKELGL